VIATYSMPATTMSDTCSGTADMSTSSIEYSVCGENNRTTESREVYTYSVSNDYPACDPVEVAYKVPKDKVIAAERIKSTPARRYKKIMSPPGGWFFFSG
jgi:hypothetical protein